MTHSRTSKPDTSEVEPVDSALRPEISEALRGMHWYEKLEAARARRAEVLAKRDMTAPRAGARTDGEDRPQTVRPALGGTPASGPPQALAAAPSRPASSVARGISDRVAKAARDTATQARDWHAGAGRVLANRGADLASLAPLSGRVRATRDRIGGAMAGLPRRFDPVVLSDRVRGIGGRIGRAIRNVPERWVAFGGGAAAGLAIGAGTAAVFGSLPPQAPPAPLSAAACLDEIDTPALTPLRADPEPDGPAVRMTQHARVPAIETPLPALPAASAAADDAAASPIGPVTFLRTDTPAQGADADIAAAQAETVQSTGAPVAESVEADGPAADAPPAPDGPRVFVFFEEGAPASRVTVATLALQATDLRVASSVPVAFRIAQTHVRFFRPEDRAGAVRVADATGAEVRDFTHFRPIPPGGTIELWLAGP